MAMEALTRAARPLNATTSREEQGRAGRKKATIATKGGGVNDGAIASPDEETTTTESASPQAS
jgi:hypothetical protein